MAILHRFIQTDFGNGFKSNGAILNITPFNPEVLFLGTFNPDTEANKADFFYGRNWFWPALFNIFKYQNLCYTKKREFSDPLTPSLDDILFFCRKYKITFADLISSVLYKHNPIYSLERNEVLYKGIKYDLFSDNDLITLSNNFQVEWATDNIIEYLTKAESIHTVYFTRQITLFTTKWDKIVKTNYGRKISFRKIYTPSGRGISGSPLIYFLIRHWLYNNDIPRYDKIDMNWIRSFIPEFDYFK